MKLIMIGKILMIFCTMGNGLDKVRLDEEDLDKVEHDGEGLDEVQPKEEMVLKNFSSIGGSFDRDEHDGRGS